MESMRTGPRLMAAAWSNYWRLMRRYHRFEVRGLDNLERAGSSVIVGYHGRAVAHDMCLLMELMRERRGVAIRAVMHRTAARIPGINWMVEGLGFVTGDGDEMADLIARGDHLMITPGGPREGCRSFRERYQVNWGQRHGYLKLALRHGLPIVPTAGTGVDETYIGLNNGYKLGKRVGMPASLPLWFAFGLTGPWPFTLPFPTKITCHIGEPIDLRADGPVDIRDRAALAELHQRVAGAVQSLLDNARSGSSAGNGATGGARA